jgi:hypothetical protein
MLSHIASDLHQAYLEEVFTPKLGKPGASTPPEKKSTSPADLDGDGDVDTFEKKVRQFIYDVRHLMRSNNIPVERAFQIRSSKTNYGADVVKAAKEKLGIKAGSTAPVSEESERMVTVTVNYKNGTTDRRNVPYSEVRLLRTRPTVRSVEISSNKVSYPGAGEKYEKKYGKGGKNTVGDLDKDGTKEPNKHEYAGVKDNAIKKSMSKKSKLKGYGVSEGFSNWRQDLKEVSGVDDEITSRDKKQVKENPKVNNKSIIKINPVYNEEVEILGGQIIEAFELDEEYIDNAINIATEFFYNCGLNENGVDIVIEELGEERFAEFVFDMAEEYTLTEERAARKRKGGKSYEEVKAEIDAKEAAKKEKAGKKITADKAKKATETAKKEQAPSSEKSSEGKKEGIFGRIKKGIEAHKEATRKTAETINKVKTGVSKALNDVADSKLAQRGRIEVKKGLRRQQKAIDKVAPAVGKAAGRAAANVPAIRNTFNAGKKVGAALREDFEDWVNNLIEEGYDLSEWTTEELYEEYGYLCEKAESEQQQKLFGLSLSVKRGETPRSEASPEVLKIVNTMPEKKIRDFAKTKHAGIPKKVEESISSISGREDKSPTTTKRQRDAVKKQLENNRNKYKMSEDMEPRTSKQISAQNQVLKAEKNLSAADQQALQQKKKDAQKSASPQLQKQSYELEGEIIDERRREEKGTPRKPRGPAFEFVAKRMGSSRLGVQPRGKKKEPGKKPPVAGQYGSGRRSPEQIVKTRRELAQKSIDSQSSRFD